VTLEELNDADATEVRKTLLACCGSSSWAEKMLAARPWPDVACLHADAESIWQSLSNEDWLEAFSKHPPIGEQSSAKWSAQEQRGMAAAGEDVAARMQHLNLEYAQKFSWIFIICATGKSAEEMAAAMEQRLTNDAATEIDIAASEQAKIMHLRLDKLLAE
jgi:OHCU decarboxylase